MFCLLIQNIYVKHIHGIIRENMDSYSHLKDKDRGHDSTGAWPRLSSGESRDQKTVNVQKGKAIQ